MAARGCFLVLAAVFFTAAAMAQPETKPPSAKPPPVKRKQTRSAYRGELDHLLNENRTSCKADADCTVIALGARPCGGPSEFISASKATLGRIQSAVTDLTLTIEEMDRTANTESGVMGTCEALAKPQAACVRSRCQTKP